MIHHTHNLLRRFRLLPALAVLVAEFAQSSISQSSEEPPLASSPLTVSLENVSPKNDRRDNHDDHGGDVPEPQQDAEMMATRWGLPIGGCRPVLFHGWLANPLHPGTRHRNWGEPLQGTSWLNRPYFAGWFAGTAGGSTLIDGQIEQSAGFLDGFWLGYDLAHYWGSELRLSLSYAPIIDLPDQTRGRTARQLLGDANVLYYPWGDTRWRPYGSVGIGMAGIHFVDRHGVAVDHTSVQLPLGFGLKYQWKRWLALRLDAKDNLAMGGSQLNTRHNWSFTGGLEVHWGRGSSTQYYPW